MKAKLSLVYNVKLFSLLLFFECYSKTLYLVVLDLIEITCYILLLNKQTLLFLYNYFPFYVEACFESTILEIVDWAENDSKLALYWLIFIVLMSLCVRNEYGHDIETTHYVIFSIAMGYCIRIHKEFYPRETRFLFFKICIVCSIVLQIFWPLILYLWPFNYWIISPEEFKNLFFFIWPELNFINPDKYDFSFLACDKYPEAKTIQKEWYCST
jgi:hypothetical protein